MECARPRARSSPGYSMKNFPIWFSTSMTFPSSAGVGPMCFWPITRIPKSPRIVLAQEGGWVSDQGARLQLHLKNGAVYEFNPEDPSKDNVSVFVSTDIPIDLSPGLTSQGVPADCRRRGRSSNRARLIMARDFLATSQARREQQVELHRRIALPFSVIGFTLLGLTLGVTTKKGGRALGFVLSFIFVLLFFTLFSGGIRLASVGKVPPWLGVWGANLILLGIGRCSWRRLSAAST